MKKLCILMICLFFVTGCSEPRVLERISLATLVGYDIEESDQVTASVVLRQINPEFQSKIEVHSETEETSKGTRVKVNMKTAKKVMAGQMRVILFGDKLAKKGIDEVLQITKMNSEVSSSVYLAVVEGDTKSLLDYKYQNVEDIGQYVFSLLEHNIKQQNSISSTLHEVVRDHYSLFRSIALPILKREEEFISLSGIALFRHGKMVGRLPSGDTFYIMMMLDDFEYGTLELTIPNEGISSNAPDSLQVAIDSIRSHRKMKVINKDTPEIELKIKLDCRILEVHSSINTGNPKLVKKLEEEMNKKMKSEVERIIAYSQEVNSDIFGFGEHYTSHVRTPKIDGDKWQDMYQNMKVNVIIDTQIIRNGVFE